VAASRARPRQQGITALWKDAQRIDWRRSKSIRFDQPFPLFLGESLQSASALEARLIELLEQLCAGDGENPPASIGCGLIDGAPPRFSGGQWRDLLARYEHLYALARGLVTLGGYRLSRDLRPPGDFPPNALDKGWTKLLVEQLDSLEGRLLAYCESPFGGFPAQGETVEGRRGDPLDPIDIPEGPPAEPPFVDWRNSERTPVRISSPCDPALRARLQDCLAEARELLGDVGKSAAAPGFDLPDGAGILDGLDPFAYVDLLLFRSGPFVEEQARADLKSLRLSMSLTLSGAHGRMRTLARTLQAALNANECPPDLAAWSDAALHCTHLELQALDTASSGVAVLVAAFKTGAPFASDLARAVLGDSTRADLFGRALADLGIPAQLANADEIETLARGGVVARKVEAGGLCGQLAVEFRDGRVPTDADIEFRRQQAAANLANAREAFERRVESIQERARSWAGVREFVKTAFLIADAISLARGVPSVLRLVGKIARLTWSVVKAGGKAARYVGRAGKRVGQTWAGARRLAQQEADDILREAARDLDALDAPGGRSPSEPTAPEGVRRSGAPPRPSEGAPPGIPPESRVGAPGSEAPPGAPMGATGDPPADIPGANIPDPSPTVPGRPPLPPQTPPKPPKEPSAPEPSGTDAAKPPGKGSTTPRGVPTTWRPISPASAETWLVGKGLDPDTARDFVRAMSEPIEVGLLAKGRRVDAWVGDPTDPGNWVGPPGISREAAAVGVIDKARRVRVRATYELTDAVQVLRSRAAPQDGLKYPWIAGPGGGEQFMSPNLAKFLRLVAGGS
jgi:hypothetical protein